MMEFLRGLAPHHANSHTNAVAALPSRFETDLPLRPIRTQEVSAGSLNESDKESIAPQGLTEGRVSASSQMAHEKVMAAAKHTPVESSRAEQAPARTASKRPGGVPQPVLPDIAMDTRADADVSQRYRPVSSGGRPRDDTSMTLVAAPIPKVAPAVGAPLAGARANEAPLSRHSVATRLVHAVDRRPIVYVTIDRIDVRAPAPPDRSKPPAGSRSSSSATSLTEYLGARQSGRPRGAP